ncbi:MAG: hypothetical protein KIT80_10345 [Chitinophagaceae bacterium]|nr:hypothetical protein [Chitinophagaceae bacterium]MCW5927300.1 hypothetical protein [Chitinophagaceae bacterium]
MNKSHRSRRNFIQSGISAAASILISCKVSAHNTSDDTGETTNEDASCIDYGRSFICNTGQYNSVRLWIESRTIIIDTTTGKSTEYLQCGSCKSEDTFGANGTRHLFFEDNYDFLPIFGGDQVLVFRRHVDIRDSYRIIRPTVQMWGGNPEIRKVKPPVITELTTWEQMRDATAAGIPIVTTTEIENRDTGLKAIIECPCKTMNISHVKKMYQTDNGPVALPDLSKRYDPEISSLSLAFIAFNKADAADFVVETPTPVKVNGKEVVKVHHYSKLLSFPAKNKVIALGKI